MCIKIKTKYLGEVSWDCNFENEEKLKAISKKVNALMEGRSLFKVD